MGANAATQEIVSGRFGRRRSEHGSPAPEELTPTEEQVAELVAAGRSNREVASALFVTVKTVEHTGREETDER